MSAAPTPGPWKIHQLRDGTQVRGNKAFSLVATLTSGNVNANAHLIAAAPDLLAALRECVDFCKGHQEDDAKRARYSRVIAAIAKAEGK